MEGKKGGSEGGREERKEGGKEGGKDLKRELQTQKSSGLQLFPMAVTIRCLPRLRSQTCPQNSLRNEALNTLNVIYNISDKVERALILALNRTD